VRGENQLFSFADKLLDHKSNVDTGAGIQTLYSKEVPLGEVWVVTNVTALNTVTVCSAISLFLYDSGDVAALRRKAAPTILEGVQWTGQVYLVAGDKILTHYEDCAAHDLIYLETVGYKMLKAANGGPPPPGEQDLTTYTEVDEYSVLTVTADKVTTVGVDNYGEEYVYKDFGVDYFDALYINFEFLIEAASQDSCWCGLGLSNVIDDYTAWADTDLRPMLNRSSAGVYLIGLWRGYMEANDEYTSSPDTLYYCTLLRSAGSDTATLKIYSDAGRTTLLDTLTVSGFGTAKWRYLYACCNRDLGLSLRRFYGYIQNLAIG